jgi:multicomponent Na+:H+ antiporter subunit E
MRLAGRVALLVTLWLLAWGQITLAIVVSGVIVAAALLFEFPPGGRASGSLRLNPVAIARLVVHVHVQLLISNVVMARAILHPRPSADPGVLAHRLQRPSEEIITVMSSVIALSPGTMVVDVEDDSSIIYVHFFALRDVGAARTVLVRLEERIVAAIASRHPSSKESP